MVGVAKRCEMEKSRKAHTLLWVKLPDCHVPSTITHMEYYKKTEYPSDIMKINSKSIREGTEI